MVSYLSELPCRAMIVLVRAYRFLLSPWLGRSCRFEPTCSAYALDALQRHGAMAGGALTVYRVVRCHPWCVGGCDPVPEHAPRFFSRLIGKSRAQAQPFEKTSS